jgi:zinc/manganese transport system substrate-binding protein
MIRKKLLITITLILSLIILNTGTIHAEGKIKVAVTAPSLTSVIQLLGGDNIEVVSLVPPGADPHHYEPPHAELLNTLRDADIIVMTGPSHLVIESRIEELVSSRAVNAVLVYYENYTDLGLQLLVNPRTDNLNPHGYVFSYSGLEIIAKAIVDALKEVDPLNSLYYDEKLEDFLNLLHTMKSSASALNIGKRRVALISPIMQYVAKDLNLSIAYILMPEPELEVTESDILHLIDLYQQGDYEVVIITDMEAIENTKILTLLTDYNVRYVTIPLSKLKETPYLIPLAVAMSLASEYYEPTATAQQSNFKDVLTYSSLVANAVLIVLVIMFINKVRRCET